MRSPFRSARLSLLTGARQAEGVAVVIEGLRGDQAHYPASDPGHCLQRDLFDLVLVSSLENGQLVAGGSTVPKEQQA